MDGQIRRLGIAFVALFGVLFAQVAYVQVVQADNIANQPANAPRQIRAEYQVERGRILAADRKTVLAESEPNPDKSSPYAFVRTYPDGELYGQLTGYYSRLYGRSGLEQAMNAYLAGSAPEFTAQNVIDIILGRPKQGGTVITTLVPRIQRAAKDALGSYQGAVVAVDPQTGDVLAMYSNPGYDPPAAQGGTEAQIENAWQALNNDPEHPLVAHAFQDLYLPGSTFKTVTGSGALENGWGPEKSWPNPHQLDVAGTDKNIENFGNEFGNGGANTVTMAQAFEESCNVTFAEIGLALGPDKLAAQAEAYGFCQTDPSVSINCQNDTIPFVLPWQVGHFPVPSYFDNNEPALARSAIGLDNDLYNPLHLADVAAAIANGGTMYIAGEGHGGLSQRIRAWKTAHAVLGQSAGVGVVSDAVNLLNPADVARIVFASKASALASPLRLIVLDTLARSMIGDENDTGDMSSVIAAADRIRTATGAAVLLVHHTRKDSDQERGSTALRGAVDTLILCEDGDDGRQIVCQKQKDAEKFSPIPFRLVAGFGSCIVQASVGADPGSASEQAGAMTPKRRAVLKTLCDAFTARGATTTEWFKAAAVPERTFYNVRTWLVREGYVTETGSRYTVSASGRHAATAPSTAIAANGTAKVTANHSPGPPKGGREVGSEAGGSGSTHGSNSAVDRNDDAYWGNLLEDDRGRFQ